MGCFLKHSGQLRIPTNYFSKNEGTLLQVVGQPRVHFIMSRMQSVGIIQMPPKTTQMPKKVYLGATQISKFFVCAVVPIV